MGSFLEDLYLLGFSFVTDVVPLMVEDNAFATNVNLIVFTEKLGTLVGVLQTVLLSRLLLLLLLAFLLLLRDVLLAIEIV